MPGKAGFEHGGYLLPSVLFIIDKRCFFQQFALFVEADYAGGLCVGNELRRKAFIVPVHRQRQVAVFVKSFVEKDLFGKAKCRRLCFLQQNPADAAVLKLAACA